MGCKNKVNECPCTASCALRGNCCDCVAYHVKKNQFPACFFSKQGEAKWDRSIECLLEDRGIKVK